MYTVPNIEKMLTSLHQLHILCSAFLIGVFPFEFLLYHEKNVFWIKKDFLYDSFDYHNIIIQYWSSLECFLLFINDTRKVII